MKKKYAAVIMLTFALSMVFVILGCGNDADYFDNFVGVWVFAHGCEWRFSDERQMIEIIEEEGVFSLNVNSRPSIYERKVEDKRISSLSEPRIFFVYNEDNDQLIWWYGSDKGVYERKQ